MVLSGPIYADANVLLLFLLFFSYKTRKHSYVGNLPIPFWTIFYIYFFDNLSLNIASILNQPWQTWAKPGAALQTAS